MAAKIFLLFPMIFLFLPGMYLLSTPIPVYTIVITFFFLVLLFFYKPLFKKVYSFFKKRCFRILLIYTLWIILSGIFLVLFKQYKILHFIYSVFLLFLYNNYSWYLYSALLFSNFFSIKQAIKYLLFAIYIICIYGILQFVLSNCGIPILDYIQQFIVNRRGEANYSYLNGYRIYSVFEEPGYLGGFLCINLPIIYSLALSKYKIFNNIIINFIIKKTIIPIVWLTILLVKSPIWFIFSLFLTFAYFFKTIINYIIRYIIDVIIGSIIILASVLLININININVSDTFLSRVNTVINVVTNYEQFATQEASLYNRIIHYNTRLKIFKHFPITGVGYNNAEYHSYYVISKLNMPLTKETIQGLLKTKSNRYGLNGSIFWNSLSDTGIVGMILLYSFMICNILIINKIEKKLPYGLISIFAHGVKWAYISILIFSFYDIRPNFPYFWFLYGLTLCFINFCTASNRSLKRRLNEKENMA